MSVLRMRGVRKAFGRRRVLDGIDLDLGAGDRVAITGPNGSGKTTLLRLAAGLARPTAGQVTLHGSTPHDPAARQGLGVVLHDAPVYAELTPAEHLDLMAGLHGRPVPEQALREAGLASMAHHPCAGLSRGQRQRLVLATAMAVGSRMLILDEPTSSLDTGGRDWMLRALADHRAAMLVAVHDDETAHRLGCRTLRLEAGRIQEGSA